MAKIEIDNDRLVLHMSWVDRVLALHGDIEVPLTHVQGAAVRPTEASSWWHGWRLPGIDLPGVITAGSFVTGEGREFYDIHDAGKSIAIDLDHEKYRRLVVEVDDEAPEAAVARIQAAIARSLSDAWNADTGGEAHRRHGLPMRFAAPIGRVQTLPVATSD